ncbi:WASH complex subunit 2 isoform X2 [Cyclopterus lumpus]|uniref:WASH complex subunit 2 isoform X2 n=1 Tax=Cyclopterus lumpus TaxID=8103 RepID=UPI001486AD0C|nr:WASH complex subunit 2 isoform X2 [Cyclopterus lumpus]
MSGLPEGVANGPSRSEYLKKDAQTWERPWTLEEMRQSSANWSLAADSGLFLFLQDFSQRMLSKTHDIEKQLDSLIRDTKATDSCLHSVFNDFLMLSNTQFIENRVYDEEVEETIPKADALEKQPEQEKSREQKEAELIPKMQEAVNHGLRVLESAFEHLDIKAGNSDSEDEEVTDRVEDILEPKDLYVDRPLPYLIGSQAFMEQEDVGLGDLSSDEMSVDSDRDSVIDSEDGKEAVHSDDDFNQVEDEGHNIIRKKSSMLSYDDDDDDDDEEEEDDDSDIFGESDRDEDDDDDDDSTKNTGPSSFADELAARIKGEPVKKPEGDRASLSSKKKSKSRKEPKPAMPQAAEEDSDDMFKPPKMDDDDFSPFGGKSGLFSGGRGLFDDDEEGDLFSEAPKPPVSEEKRVLNESMKSTLKTAESDKSGKKIPAGAISVFPDNSLFGSGIESDSVESKENGHPAPKTSAASKQVPMGAAFGEGGGGLFDDEDEDDDFFSGSSLTKSDSAGDKKPKKVIDLFDEEEDDDGDIFSEKYSAPTPAQSQKEVVEEQIKPPEKKMPAGAISMFGPGTQSLLNEGLKKCPPSPSKESEKSVKNGPAPDAAKAAVKQTQKPQTRGLFSDDEDTPGSPAIPRSQSKPEFTSQAKTSKPLLSLFDDEEEEDLFASAAKSKAKPNQAKASTPQLNTAVSSSLFSDDEDQWVSSVSSAGKPEVKTGGMKPSASAPSSLTSGPSSLTSGPSSLTSVPSSLTSGKMSLKSSLFDNYDEDDLFAPTTESSQKKSQRVALLFEDEGDDDEDKGSVSGIKHAVNTNTAAQAAKTPAASSQSSSLLEESDEVIVSRTAAQDQPSEQEEPAAETPEPLPSAPSPEISQSKKKPAGAVSLFGGINVLANKQTKSLLEEVDNDDSPPPNVKREEKVKTNTVSLFDDEEEDESDWNEPIFTPSKPPASDTLTLTEERPQATSTGVFQDEELLFSQTQQKDNDPDVDLFATSDKAASSKLSSAKPATQSLFAEDDEDELFGSIKPKAPPPKVAEKPSKPIDRAPLASPESVSEIQKPDPSPVKPKDSSSRIGKLQANLMIDPTTLLPGVTPIMPGAVNVLPGMAQSSSSGMSSSSLSPSPATSPTGAQKGREGGVNFDSPVQVTTLQSAHKSRAKGFVQRRPQSRAARQQAAHRSLKDKEDTEGGYVPGPNLSLSGSALPPPDRSSQTHASPILANSAAPADLPASSPSQSSLSETSPRPPVLNTGKKDTSEDGSSTKGLPSYDEDDLFGSDSLFRATSVTNTPSTRQTTKTTQPQVKPRSTTKKAKTTHYLEEDDDDEDIFGVSNSSTQASANSKEIKNSSSFSKQDIFQGEVSTVPKVHKKHKEKTLDASLFDDNIDIFADLSDTLTPKQKSKRKGETKSIFDDDMDDIFSPSTVKPVMKAPQKSKKTPRSQETSTEADSSNIFDDPLNALGGN